jgi:hypothetical protein
LYRDVSRIAFFLEYMYSKYSVFNLLPIQYWILYWANSIYQLDNDCIVLQYTTRYNTALVVFYIMGCEVTSFTIFLFCKNQK